jgi:3-dehydroquinate dehydratase
MNILTFENVYIVAMILRQRIDPNLLKVWMIDYNTMCEYYNKDSKISFIEQEITQQVTITQSQPLNSDIKSPHIQTNVNEQDQIYNIVKYTDFGLDIDVIQEGDETWMSQQGLAKLYATSRPNITMHISNIFKEDELDENSVCKEFLHTGNDGKMYSVKHYNVKMTVALGFRVKSEMGTYFRQWANSQLEVKVKGIESNDINAKLAKQDEKIDALADMMKIFIESFNK